MIQFDSGTLNLVEVVRDLGVLLDAELSIKQHVTPIAFTNCADYGRLDPLSAEKYKKPYISIDIHVCAVATRLL